MIFHLDEQKANVLRWRSKSSIQSLPLVYGKLDRKINPNTMVETIFPYPPSRARKSLTYMNILSRNTSSNYRCLLSRNRRIVHLYCHLFENCWLFITVRPWQRFKTDFDSSILLRIEDMSIIRSIHCTCTGYHPYF